MFKKKEAKTKIINHKSTFAFHEHVITNTKFISRSIKFIPEAALPLCNGAVLVGGVIDVPGYGAVTSEYIFESEVDG